MHSSRMRTAWSLTVSRRILCMPPPPQPRMPPHQPRMPLATIHAPPRPHMPPRNHACSLPTTHAPQYHARPPATMHAPGRQNHRRL